VREREREREGGRSFTLGVGRILHGIGRGAKRKKRSVNVKR